MKKLFIILGLSLICMFCAVGFAACDNNMETGGNTPTEQASDNEKNNDRDNQNDDNDKHIHLYIETIINPTCTEQGYIKHVCSICGDNYKDNYERALGHNYNEITTNPTCTERGYVTYTCERCADSYSTPFGNAAGHNYQSTITAPTCTENGYTTHTCVECGDSYIDTYTNPTGHSYESKWTYDGEFHWHNSSCGHELIKDKETHIFNGTVCSCGYDLSSAMLFEKIAGTNEYSVSEILDTEMTCVYIPESYDGSPITKLDDALFYENNTIEKVIMANTIQTIGRCAFYGCLNLQEIIFSANIIVIQEKAFYNCSKITEIMLPNKVQSIGEYVFGECTSLKKITIPDSIQSIRPTAFSHCPIEVAKIPAIACIPIEKSSRKEDTNVHLIVNNILTTVEITSGDIGTKAFYQCRGLRTVIISDNVKSIGYAAFGGFYGDVASGDRTSMRLREILFGENCKLETISDYAFANCIQLTNIVIPNNVRNVGDYAFSGCRGLTSVTIGNSVTSVGDYAFSGCSSLTSITFNGTTEQWQAISKGNSWKYNVPSSCKVHCTDGDINI